MTEETAAALARLRAWVRSEAEGADLPEHYPATYRGMMDVERLVAAVEAMHAGTRSEIVQRAERNAKRYVETLIGAARRSLDAS